MGNTFHIPTMKVTLILLLPCLIAAKPSGLPEIRILETRSTNGIPAIDITFPDGFQDKLVLERHYMTEMDRMAQKMHCNFIGHLAIDAEACVAHEMGHNMGMSHDFADVHGGDNGACNGQGLMSYG